MLLRPWLITVPGVTGVEIPASSSGDEVRFVWPATGRVSGLFAQARSGDVADAALLSLFAVDAGMQAIVTDGRGPESSSFLALCGRGLRWFALNVEVKRGDVWTFQITNEKAAPLVPNLYFRLEPSP